MGLGSPVCSGFLFTQARPTKEAHVIRRFFTKSTKEFVINT
jgi:hypothetical protein